MKLIFLYVFVSLTTVSCSRNNATLTEPVEIYLLKNSRIIPGKCQVDASTAMLQDTAIVKNEDIFSFVKANSHFLISGLSSQKIKSLADGTPFAVAVNKEVIYFGILKPSYSSSSCSGSITMDYVGQENTIMMKLGYVGADPNIDDQRSNPRLLAALKSQGKLK